MRTDPLVLTETPPSLRVTGWIDRNRRLWFVLVGLLMAISFNGRWAIGPDSAAYRGLGHSLATTGRYFFREKVAGLEDYADQQGTRYPGLPVILAGLEKLFGPGDLPPLIFMNALVVLLLVLTYRLMLYRVPRWLAVAVVVGMGTNARFLQYANEILTDIPFLLGLVTALLGYERLLRAKGGRQLTTAGVVMLAGMLLAASLRPTFWFFAVAVVGACMWGLVAGRPGLLPDRPRGALGGPVGRWKFGLLLGTLALAATAFLLAGVSHGGYESRVFGRMSKLIRLSPGATHDMLESALPIGFFGSKLGSGLVGPGPDPQELETALKRARRTPGGVVAPVRNHKYGFGSVYSLLVIGAGVWLMSRNVLWGLLVAVSIGSFALTGAVPRYFVMLLPLLLAGWGLLCHGFARQIGRRLRWPLLSELTLLAALGAVVGINLLVASLFILKQRGLTRPIGDDGKWHGMHHTGFLSVYHRGIWQGVYDLAAMVRDIKNTRPDQKLLGPEATVLTYLCQRQVYFPQVAEVQRVKSGRGAESFFKLALMPVDGAGSRFSEYDAVMRKLAELHVITTGRVLAGPVAGYELVEFAVVPPHPRGPRHRTSTKAAATSNAAPTTSPAAPAVRTDHRPRPATVPQ